MYRCKTLIIALITCFLALNLNAFDKDEETFEILKALTVYNTNPNASIKSYTRLYENTKNSEYLKEAIKIAYVYKTENLGKLIDMASDLLDNDAGFLKIKSAYLVENGNKNEALISAKKLVELEPDSAMSYSVAGMIMDDLGEYKKALDYHLKAYELDDSDINLLRVANILLVRFDDVNLATSKLEKHRLMKGCSTEICSVLLDIYKQNRNFPMILAMDEELYKLTNDNKYMDEVLGFYIYEKNYEKVIELLEKYSYNDKLLVELYAYIKEYDKAIKKADESYNASNDKEFLSLKAMMIYEKNVGSINSEILKDVNECFKASVDENSKGIYQNYYGYLLIDHDIDAKKGVEFVKNALKDEPNSPYYLDSLAWGYYKLGECEKAKKTIDAIDLEFSDYWDSNESKEHIKKIDECLKDIK
ncbi:hypothetical protein [Campylobacter corcagiensis]|uniref:Tetratricopeptide repeat protein n=1 Tax=Campylobacter corcagiensis TaxID=1448857 RepID=A0A7M1LFW5_9BACT|nr:hypothetical protein [Campylobacter corcagiensis]QKF64500.1 putative tetratricopeptide repeat lipoprotein [Campylobacter corcagiensis]QOQ87320.1 hypothetical protein IMC76_00400 [Campylobacter corcagiensis]